MCAHECRCLQRPEGLEVLEFKIQVVVVNLTFTQGVTLWSSVAAVSLLYPRAISLVPLVKRQKCSLVEEHLSEFDSQQNKKKLVN